MLWRDAGKWIRVKETKIWWTRTVQLSTVVGVYVIWILDTQSEWKKEYFLFAKPGHLKDTMSDWEREQNLKKTEKALAPCL